MVVVTMVLKIAGSDIIMIKILNMNMLTKVLMRNLSPKIKRKFVEMVEKIWWKNINIGENEDKR